MPELRLNSFETDESNKFALALLGAVAQLEKGYSPLLIHGGQGCGKTHLLSALTTELATTHPEISLLYIPEDFPIEKLLLGNGNGANSGSKEFLYKAYSRKDLLIVDDIERFGDDPKLRVRFYSLFDAFVDNAKQVVLASSSPIEELDAFNDRFRSRRRGFGRRCSRRRSRPRCAGPTAPPTRGACTGRPGPGRGERNRSGR